MKFRTCAIAILMTVITLQSHADILITPIRVVFGAKDRVQEVIIVNTANESRTYALSWVEMTQLDRIGYSVLDTNEAATFAKASDFIRFTPRRITLQPGENQRVKLMLRRTSDSQNQDYRSHLKFTVIPNSVLQDNLNNENNSAKGPSIKLNLFLNYSIPIIIKNESSVQNVTFSNLAFARKSASSSKPALTFALNKTSPGSSFGDITLLFRALNSDDFLPVGYSNNVQVHHETTILNGQISWSESIAVQPGELKVIYKGKQETVDTIYDEASLQIK
ncbi:MAG: fimbrial chaperone protein [Glaciecola sp.]|jgi:fimbrial chaperone protein